MTSVHHFSDTERKSYVDYINKILGNDDNTANNLPIPLDPSSPTQLFEIAAKGILLGKLVNKSFPNTINEKKVNLNPKNVFETNLNHDLTIEAAKGLGCSVVNIGASDLSSGNSTLILGLLWQIIKKSLLKEVNVSNPEIKELFESEAEAKEASTMSPEQILLQWFNYHLKKAGVDRVVKNFQSDVCDSENYALLLRHIAPKEISESDIKSILAETDTLKRAEQVIELAKRIIPSDQSLFVTPEDIVNANPRLNLAFTATIFNSHPGLESSGPSKDEIAAMESQKASLVEKAETLAKEKEVLETRIQSEIAEKTQLLELVEQLKHQITQSTENTEKLQNRFEQQIKEEVASKEEVQKQLNETITHLETVKTEVQQEKQKNDTMTTENNELKTKLETLESNIKTLQTEFQVTQETAAQNIKEKETVIETVTTEKEQKIQEIQQLQVFHTTTLEEAQKHHVETFTALENKTNQEITQLQTQHQKAMEEKQKENDDTIAKLKADYESQIAKLKADHEAAMKQSKESYEQKMHELRIALQKMQDMLPSKADKEGYLVKQGGGYKTWKKRYFVLKTNFMCYYKDDKVLEWIKAIDGAKAKYKNEVLTRKTFFNLADARKMVNRESQDD